MGEPRPEEDMVSALREALERSAVITGSMLAKLDSIGNSASVIDAEIRPLQLTMRAFNVANENIDRTIEVAEDILLQFDIARRAQATISKGPKDDLKRYVEAMGQLRSIIDFFSSNTNLKSSDGLLNRVKKLLTKAAPVIEEEFRQLMDTYSKPVEPDRLFDCLPKLICMSNGAPEAVDEQPPQSSALSWNPTLIPPSILQILHDMAHHLVQDGNHQSCYKIYRDARASALQLSLQKLGVEKLNKDDVQRMQWEFLQTKIGNWNQFMQIAVKVLLAGERENCDLVFDGITLNKDQCFAELAGNSFMTLLSFGDAVAKRKMSPEKLSVLLDMYGIMHELQSEVEVIFQGMFCSVMREAALNLTKSLAQTARETLVDFIETIEKATKNTIQDGNVHPLTIHVISCAKSLFDYESTLEILKPFETGSATESQLKVVTMKILQALKNNLYGRFKLYKDSALSYIFLMNNIQYMVMFVLRSEAKVILGDDWIQRHRRTVQQNASRYRRVAWGKILETLYVPAVGGTGSSASELLEKLSVSAASGTGSSASELLETLSVSAASGAGSPASELSSTGVSRTKIKERFKSFNELFEELHVKQSQWNVPDKELQESLRLAIAEVLVPAYRSFVNRFGDLVHREKKPDKYMKRSPEEVERMLDDLFGGKHLLKKTSED